MNKSRRILWAIHVALMGAMRYAYLIFVVKAKRRVLLKVTAVGGRIMLKLI
jgi:hypothetical protein